jgi:hypothetical protein
MRPLRVKNLLAVLAVIALLFPNPTGFKHKTIYRPDPPYAMGRGNQLPEDCTIISTEAFVRLKPIAYWCKILSLHMKSTDASFTGGHTVVVWKITPVSHVLVYDREGTVQVDTISETAEDIKAAIQKLLKETITITEAHFVE